MEMEALMVSVLFLLSCNWGSKTDTDQLISIVLQNLILLSQEIGTMVVMMLDFSYMTSVIRTCHSQKVLETLLHNSSKVTTF